jgi:hypothetical protein
LRIFWTSKSLLSWLSGRSRSTSCLGSVVECRKIGGVPSEPLTRWVPWSVQVPRLVSGDKPGPWT